MDKHQENYELGRTNERDATGAKASPRKWRTVRKAVQGEFDKLLNSVKLRRHWWLRRHRPFQPLFLIATYRCGSNLVVDYLNSLRIECFGEVLCASLPISPIGSRFSRRRALNHIRMSLQSLDAPVRGCKLMIDQMQQSNLQATDLLQAFPEARFLVLYRESLAEQYLSDRMARRTMQWTLRPGVTPRREQLRVEPGEFLSYCNQMKGDYVALLRSPALVGRTVLLSYEQLTEDANYWFAERICPLVGQPPGQVHTVLRKQNYQAFCEQVENYHEVATELLSPHVRQRYVLPKEAPPSSTRWLARRAA